MPRVTLSLSSDTSDRPGLPAPSAAPIELIVPEAELADIWSFLTCLATKTDTLLPAVMAIVACARSSAGR